MTTIYVTNEFVQFNRSLLLIWSYDKRGPSISLFKKAISYSTQDYNKTKDLSSIGLCRKVEKDT